MMTKKARKVVIKMSEAKNRQEEHLDEHRPKGVACGNCSFYKSFQNGRGSCNRDRANDPIDDFCWCGGFLPSVAFLPRRSEE